MKNTKTIAVSIPKDLSEQIDRLATENRLSRSALLTMIIAFYLKERK